MGYQQIITPETDALYKKVKGYLQLWEDQMNLDLALVQVHFVVTGDNLKIMV